MLAISVQLTGAVAWNRIHISWLRLLSDGISFLADESRAVFSSALGVICRSCTVLDLDELNNIVIWKTGSVRP